MAGRKFDLDNGDVVVVIGSGAGGGTLSHELARRGIDVVCLEAGGRLDMGDIVNNEAEMFKRITWLDRRIGTGANIPEFPSWTCKTVGGTTVHWTAVCPRFQAHEFAPLSTYGKLDGADFIDWPLTLDELEPYYAKAEKKMGVTGTNGQPPLPASNNCMVMTTGGARAGYRDISSGAPMAINSADYDGRSACRQLGFCTSGCAIAAKWSTLYTEIPKAEKTGHFELREKSMAVQVEHDDKGVITGVTYLAGDGTRLTQKARAVCVAANAIETTRLLLNSTSEKFPDGLGNHHGLVGRHYMRQFTNMVMSEMPGEVNFHRGTQVNGLIRDEARHDPRRGFVGGYVIAPVPLSPENLAANVMAGKWGEELAGVMQEYTKFAGLIMIGEDPPQAGNRITLHPSLKDRHGLPVPVVHYEEHANTVAMRAHAFAAGRRIHGAVGAKRSFDVKDVPAGHNLGACRMSSSDKTGVCDRWGRVFGLPNLFVSDGSLFPSSAAEMPTLTIVSLAIRQAEYLAGELKPTA